MATDLKVRISADSSPFTRAIGEVNGALDKALSKSNQATSGFKKFGDQLSSIGNTLSVGVTLPVIALGAAVVNSAANMDALKRGLIAVSGSAAEAERQFVGLKEVAKLPGLGLKEAVQGSINLQALGNSAEQSQRILKVFGNALATVGRGREDLAESIRQLGQLGARGQVTADNLKPLIERIPQLATIIKEKFGAEALGNPAETFKKLGIDSKAFIEIILTELGKLPLVTGGAKNAIENFKDTVDQTAARIGEKLLPAVEALLPKLEKFITSVADMVDEFTKLSPEVQLAGLAFVAAAAAAGPLLVVAGSLVSAYTTVATAFSGAGIAATALAPALGALAFAFEYGKDVQAIIEAFKEFKFQATALVSAGKEAKENLGFLFEQIKKGIPFSDGIGASFRLMKTILEEIARASTLPGTQFLLKTLEFLSATIETVTGRSRSMEEAVKANIGRQLEFGAAAQKAVLDSNSLGDSAKRLREQYAGGDKAAKASADAIKAVAEAAKNAKKPIDELAEAFTRLGVANTTDAIGGFVKAQAAFDTVKKAYDQGKTSSVDLTRATEALGAQYLKLIDGLGGVRPKIIDIADAFDFARERAFLAIGDIQAAAAGARNIAFGRVIVPGGQANNPALNEAQNRAAGKRGVDIVRENTKDAIDVWKQAQAKIRQAVSTITTDFSRGIADIITNGGKIGELFEKLGKQIANTLIRTVIEGGINQVTKSLAGLLTSLGGVGAKVGVLFGGSLPSGVIKNAAGSAPQIGAAGASAASSASSAGSSVGSIAAAANPIVAMVTAVSSVVSAISAVVANFQFAAMNKTLDLIEREVRYTKIYTGGQSDSILNTAHESLEALRSIAASTKGLIGINISGTLNDAETKRLIDDLLNGSGSFYAQSARTLTAIHQAIVGGFDVLTGQVNAASKQNIFQKIFSGGALSSGSLFSGLGQGMSGAFSSAVGGVINSAVGGAKESTLGAVEKEARFSQIHLLNILEKMNQYLPKLADIHQRLVEIIVDGLKIREGGEGLTVNITVNGSMIGGPNVAAELSQMVVANLKLQGVRA